MDNERTNANQSAIIDSVAYANLFLRREYLQCIEEAQIVGLPDSDVQPWDAMRLLHLDTLLYDSGERISDKLKTLFGAVESYGESVVLIVNGKRDRVELYLGVSGQPPVQPVYGTFQHSLNALFPGCRYRALHNDALRELMDELLPLQEPLHISAVSAFPSEDGETSEDAEKLDMLIDGMRHQPFSLFLIAKAATTGELAARQQLLHRLYTELSPMERTTISLSQNDTESIGQSISKAVTDSITYNANISRGTSVTEGGSTSEQYSPENTEENQRHRSMVQLAGTGAALLLPGLMGVEKVNMLQNLFYGSSLSTVLLNGERALGMAEQETKPVVTISTHRDNSRSEGQQFGVSSGRSENDQQGMSVTINTTQGESRQTTQVNKALSEILALLEKQIQQLSTFQREGAFNVAAYFVAGDRETAISAANLFRSLSTSPAAPTARSPISSWHRPAQIAALRRYLCYGRHPVFSFPLRQDFPKVQLAQTIGLSDMVHYFALPERTLPGLIVSASARFARDVVAPGASAGGEARQIPIGNIYFMGKEDRRVPVRLKVDDLTKHLFVAGATGVGKSNFCYQLLDSLDGIGVRMLIIEPAKGEYRHVLGGRKGFHVFGVDPRTGPLLRINPFAHPDGISTVQHIERLLDIFNTAWPMYSAMPAILKEAVELIYAEKGFDLTGAERPAGAVFPCFQDLLDALPRVISQSSYSSEVKGNYTGALVTRVRSMTNGLYGIIFDRNEIGDATLFDENVIADISRIGSMETKALLMGVLTMRLVEYRMAEGRMNSPLRHVTVLEEAHNLLRRYNPSPAEGGSMRASSVEMLSSAIAEMRTYGEGFIIADQSPSVMDLSVIRNTQTKLFFMLPEREDRAVAANTLALNEAQQQEIGRLVPGVAAVYQSGWTDAVLCKINYFDPSKERPFLYVERVSEADRRELVRQAAAVTLKRRVDPEASSVDEAEIDRLLKCDSDALDRRGRSALGCLRAWRAGNAPAGTREGDFELLSGLLPIDQILRGAGTADGIERWSEAVESAVLAQIRLSDDEVRALVSLGLREWSSRAPQVRKLYVQYISNNLKQQQKK